MYYVLPQPESSSILSLAVCDIDVEFKASSKSTQSIVGGWPSALSFAGGPPDGAPAKAGATELIPIITANITNAVNASFVFIAQF